MALKKKINGGRSSDGALTAMLIPGTLFMIAFSFLPMIGIIIAFKRVNYAQGIFNSPWCGFENFKFFLNSSDAVLITRNTLLYNIAFIAINLIVSVFCAIMLNEIRRKSVRNIYQASMFLPYFLSWVTVSYLVYAFLNPEYGFINKQLLEKIGLKGIMWYNEPKYWPFLIIFIQLWKSIGYNTVIYFATIVGFDSSYYEAAAIDGASRLQQIKHITIPNLVSTMIVLTILQIGKVFHADFGLFYQTTMDSGALYPVTNVLDTYVFRGLKTSGEIGMSAAAGLYQAVCGFILVMVTNMIVRRIDKDQAMF